MDRIRHAVVNAQWFSALGSYQPSEGQIALPNLSAWDRPRFPAELDTSLAKIASDMDWLPSSRDQPDPIVNRAGRMVAALNISGQANRTSAKVMQETMLPPLLAAARGISALL